MLLSNCVLMADARLTYALLNLKLLTPLLTWLPCLSVHCLDGRVAPANMAATAF